MGDIKGEMLELDSDIQLRGETLKAKCGLQIKDGLKNKDTKKENTSFVASFVILFDLKSKITKIKDLQSNFFI